MSKGGYVIAREFANGRTLYYRSSDVETKPFFVSKQSGARLFGSCEEAQRSIEIYKLARFNVRVMEKTETK